MANEIIELPVKSESGMALALTRDAVASLKEHRALLLEYVKSQLTENVDYGVIPGTDKASLYKPGSEKLRALFSLQTETKMVEGGKELDRPGNFAMFTYRTEVRDKYGNLLATCEGSCNSQEKKYRERSVYKNRQKVGTEATPVCDILNTLQKMAQKRSFVGAVILATGASDFFSQDIDDPEDAAAHGMDPEKKPAARAQVSIPKPTSASSADQAHQAPAPGALSCEVCNTALKRTKNNNAWNCPNWDDGKGKHTYIKD